MSTQQLDAHNVAQPDMLTFSQFVEKEAGRMWHGDHKKRSLSNALRFSNFSGFGDWNLDRFHPDNIHAFFDMLAESGRGDNTINHYGSTLAKTFSHAKSQWYIKSVPSFTWKELTGNKRPLYYTKPQLLAIEEHFDEYHDQWWMRHLIIIGAETGMRIGEILTLEPSSISCDDIGNTWAYLPTTKNGDERFVPINPRVRKALRELDDHPSKYWTEYHFYRSWGAMRLRVLNGNRLYVFHTLRHTCATRMANDLKANTAIIGLLLGHRSEATTRKYIKSKPESLQALVAQF